MKKKIFACALIAICLSIVAYGTTAYFTYESTANNVIVAGDVQAEQVILSEDASGGSVSMSEVFDVTPGVSVEKNISVKNTGSFDCWVRISMEKDIVLAEGKEGVVDLSLVTYDINTEYWVEKNGWYYYLKPLAPGATTEPLISEVHFSVKMGNMYQESRALLHVTTHATQTANNGTNVFEAAGWPVAN